MGSLAEGFNNRVVDESEVWPELMRINRQIQEASKPVMIFLFGSLAEGKFRLHSDIDLLVVYSSVTEVRSARTELAKARILPKWPCDYLFFTEEKFNIMKDIGGPCYMAFHHGKKLYDQKAAV